MLPSELAARASSRDINEILAWLRLRDEDEKTETAKREALALMKRP